MRHLDWRTILFAAAFVVMLWRILSSFVRFGVDISSPVHMALSADKSQWRAMLACINSTLAFAQHAERFRFHVFCTEQECAPLLKYIQTTGFSKSDAMFLATFYLFPIAHALRFAEQTVDTQFHIVEFSATITDPFARQSISSSAARNLSSPHNYVRFYMPQLLPDVNKIIWVDNDVLANDDVALLFDSVLLHADRHALAEAVVRRPYDSSMVRRIIDGMAGRPFGRAPVGEKRPRSLNMEHGEVLKPLLERLKDGDCTEESQGDVCFHFNAGIGVYRLDLWRRFDYTSKIEKWLLFLADNPAVAPGLTQPPLIFQFWEDVEDIDQRWNVGSAADIEAMLEANDPRIDQVGLFHFNGDGKPWLSDNPRMRALWEPYAPKEEPM